MRKITEEWLKLAVKDLESAEILINEDHLANIVLFHCQQCVEKSLKAILEEEGQTIPKIHNIKRLHTIIKDTSQFSCLKEEEMDFLDSIYIDSRYPSSFGILPSGFPGKEEAEEGIRIARRVYELVKEGLTG